MPPKRLSPEHRSLQRRQLDAKLGVEALRHLKPPKHGWIRAVRTALGMTSAQLGKRLSMTAQGAADLERRESEGTVTLETLRKAAGALECDLLVVLVPRTSLEQMIRDQAAAKAAAERDSVLHTMALEAQQSGVTEAIDPSKDVESWLTTRINRLWD